MSWYISNETLSNIDSFVFSNREKYIEKVITLNPKQYYDFEVTFSTSGIKIFQTFGLMDTSMTLYLGENVLKSSNNEGYSTNSLMNYYVSANTTYKIRVQSNEASETIYTKFLIVPAFMIRESSADVINSYEDIRNYYGTNLSLLSYAQNNYVQIFTFTPSVTGNYRIFLETEFDSYLYVIDPRSSSVLVEGTDYDDDGCSEYDGYIWRELTVNVPYLIVFSHYDLSYVFEDLDEGDNVRVRISLVS